MSLTTSCTVGSIEPVLGFEAEKVYVHLAIVWVFKGRSWDKIPARENKDDEWER